MKFLSFIAILFVLLLSVKPCCSDNDCLNQRTSNIAKTSTAPKEKDCQGCSPFFSCGACATGFVVEQSFYHDLAQATVNPINHNNPYQQPHLEDVSLAIWLPPQLS
ncbi:hypothetical protein [Mucilaginibacter flavus]|uniref:hypothetical protein n=1 Tax=Mucilaginibacter flavus TaxID=931504 RepID=UPI0025B5725C|nr:hypothetical protein [Mucilaginibacter flavus]MDN3584114.1 hypothetical protein [Mucilaginibacter flavus]